MIQFLLQHQFWAAVGVYWMFSAAVSSMPEPGTNSNPGYLWLYRFLHTTAGNITTAFGSRIPGMKVIAGILLLPIVFSASACAAHYAVHPGALSTGDSAAYDTLLIASTTIDQAKTAFAAGQLPADSKDVLNSLIRSYTVARDSYLTYRGALATNVPSDPYFQQLTKNLTDLTTAIQALKGVKAQ